MKITKKTNTRRGNRVKSTEQKSQLHKNSIAKNPPKCKYQDFANIAANLSAYHLSRVSPGQPEATFHFCQFLEAINLENYFLQKSTIARMMSHD